MNKDRGLFERKRGSGIWWIRYADQYGKNHREKVGPKSEARKIYYQRKTEARLEQFSPSFIVRHVQSKAAELNRLEKAVAKNTALLRLPEIPQPSLIASRNGSGLPTESGIYFVWNSGEVVYVGQTISLKHRARLCHEHIEEGDQISFLRIEREELNFSENYYIGIARPSRNRR